MKLLLPEEVWTACYTLKAEGYDAYVVGGGVRDLLLGSTPKDWDLATNALPQEVVGIFERAGFHVIPTGIKYGTVTVLLQDFPLEITTFRVDGSYEDFRRPEGVEFVDGISDDLARRDYTVNALAYNPLRQHLYDPFGGEEDLSKGIIRTVGEPTDRFNEDPLRILRGIRLSSELGFRLDEKTRHGINRNAELICRVSAERIRDEFSRILTALHFMKGLELLLETGILFLIIPELKEGWLFAQYNPTHQYSVLEHTFEAMRYTPSSLKLRLTVLLHDVAKPRCFTRGEDGRGHFYEHDRMGAEMAERILRRLRYNTQMIRDVRILVREHMLDVKMGPAGMRRLVNRIGRELLKELLIVREADFLAHSLELVLNSLADFESFRVRLQEILQEGLDFEMRDMAIGGSDVLEVLQCPPGPIVGRVLRVLWDEVLNDYRKNKRDYLLSHVKKIAGELGWENEC